VWLEMLRWRVPRRNPTGLETMTSIVIIEEDDLMRELLHEWLTAEGYSVRDRTRSDAGCGYADLVIVDLYMPRRTGPTIVRAVQQAYPEASVIAISAQFRPGLGGSAHAARTLGARRLIAKPFTREDLLGAVRAATGAAR
jgi:CheY-like chemotaxis protein